MDINEVDMKKPYLFFLLFVGCGQNDASITPMGPFPSPTPCSVTQTLSGATIACPDGTSATITNGSNGLNGLLSTYSIVQLITPCGPTSSQFKEELLCLNNGDILASFSDSTSGNETRFSLIPAGSYQDTDDSGCLFTVSVDQNNNTTVSWGAGSDQYSTWVAGQTVCSNNQ